MVQTWLDNLAQLEDYIPTGTNVRLSRNSLYPPCIFQMKIPIPVICTEEIFCNPTYTVCWEYTASGYCDP